MENGVYAMPPAEFVYKSGGENLRVHPENDHNYSQGYVRLIKGYGWEDEVVDVRITLEALHRIVENEEGFLSKDLKYQGWVRVSVLAQLNDYIRKNAAEEQYILQQLRAGGEEVVRPGVDDIPPNQELYQQILDDRCTPLVEHEIHLCEAGYEIAKPVFIPVQLEVSRANQLGPSLLASH